MKVAIAQTFINFLDITLTSDSAKDEQYRTIPSCNGKKDKNKLFFKLDKVLPALKKQAKQSGEELPDKKTITKSLNSLSNVEYKNSRNLGAQAKTWSVTLLED